MRLLRHPLFVAAWAATLPLAAQAQATKPVAKPTARPVAKPAAKPIAKPATVAKAQPVATPAPTTTPAATTAVRPATAAPAKAAAATNAAATAGLFGVGTNVLNLGIGLGNRYGYGSGLFGGSSSVSPAISLSYERGVVPLGPGMLGVGGFVGYQGAKYDLGGGDQWKYTDLIVMVRGAFHYSFAPQFDTYGGLGLGVRYAGVSFEGNSGVSGLLGSASANEFASGLFVGGRYFFTPGIGAFAELGYDQTFLKVGLSAKF